MISENYKVSIITSSFNSEKTILKALKSVQRQTYKNIEHIYIDGASTDETLNIIKKNIRKNDILISEKDKGIYDALNKGVISSSGDIIGFVHSDDFLKYEFIIEEIVEIFFKKKCDAVYGDIEYLTNSNRRIRHWKSKRFSKNSLKNGWMPPHTSLFLKKDFLNSKNLFDDQYQISADYDLILKLFKNPNFKSEYLSKTVTSMRIGGASNKNLSEILKKMKEDYLIIKKNDIGGLNTIFVKNLRKLDQFF